MNRTVYCRKYKQCLEGMSRPPYPGSRGQLLFETVSERAWQEWLIYQTRLINEKKLNMLDLSSRNYLQGELEKFLDGDEFDQAEGYTPISPAN